MTDFVRLGSSLATIGTVLEADGERAKRVLHGWAYAMRQVDNNGERGGGLGTAGEDDRKDESKRRRRAGELYDEFVATTKRLEREKENMVRLLAVALPMHPASLRNSRTGDLDPITPADVAAAGWCVSCWRNDQQMVVIESNKSSIRYYRDYCRWCGGVKSTYGIEPPMAILKMHHDGRRIPVKEMEAAVKATIDAMPRPKKGKRKKGKQAA